MQLIFVSDLSGNITDQEICVFHQITGHVDAVTDNIFLRGNENRFFKYFSKIAAVEITPVGQLRDGDILIVISLNLHQGLMYVNLLQVCSVWRFAGGRGAYERFQDPVHISEKTQRIFMVRKHI